MKWKPIEDFCGYEVSSTGLIRSLTRTVEHGRHGTVVKHGKLIKLRIDQFGYAYVRLNKDGKRHRKTVHRLVCRAFHGEPTAERYQVAHFPDRTKTNNNVENLRWATPKENCADKVVHGTTLRGSKKSKEFCDNLSVKLKGRVFAEETKAKISAAMTGKVLSDSHKAKVLAAIRVYKPCPTCSRVMDIGNLARHVRRCR